MSLWHLVALALVAAGCGWLAGFTAGRSKPDGESSEGLAKRALLEGWSAEYLEDTLARLLVGFQEETGLEVRGVRLAFAGDAVAVRLELRLNRDERRGSATTREDKDG